MCRTVAVALGVTIFMLVDGRGREDSRCVDPIFGREGKESEAPSTYTLGTLSKDQQEW
jgi:hypothetical protein